MTCRQSSLPAPDRDLLELLATITLYPAKKFGESSTMNAPDRLVPYRCFTLVGCGSARDFTGSLEDGLWWMTDLLILENCIGLSWLT